jgi:hypothetical protein
LEKEIKGKSPDHEKQDPSVASIFERVIFGSPGQKYAEKKNSAPDDELIDQ